uniref:DUF659 domain-containing protein n=1 Tax=Panagrellus redivivus TaxID=6233 RepID=A0A7E4V5G5_PANRE
MEEDYAPPPPCSDDEDGAELQNRRRALTDPVSQLHEFILINDAVHIESITLRRAWKSIVDNPAYQSLRVKRFFGFCSAVYLGAKATVFDHCLGTYHVARKILSSLKLKQKWLIDDVDEYCIEIAALFAHSGRAPYFKAFSKLWGSDYDPKRMAVRMFTHVMENYVKDKLDMFLSPRDVLFIKELLNPPEMKFGTGDTWLMHGRPKEKAFLYEIVVNTDSGLDARFLDYITRSCTTANYGINFNMNTLGRIVNTVLVVTDGSKPTLVYSAAVLRNIQDMFQSSVQMDREVVRHKKVIAFEITLEKALNLAESYNCPGTNNRVPLFRIHEDINAFIRLGDDIISNV